ncbi:PSD1 and planctomycete cytochrome C domain-containing protein [Lignipirellula cremea]|uniref:Planctomycete cytochrome C n=1 Tax=Lignipirellula cremea TaxID=2528010 RepID=A0A518E504_9BACT|nr:PSD1 and planctomycete cytochrome C domain-containing protein [Lignipirellula cremea]QDU99180.1 Planctomycete cytochrome C [Lignipirellula cremea]
MAINGKGFWLVMVLLGVSAATAEEPMQFNRDIRPLLSQNCFRCHGPDAEQRQGDLRLDTEAGIRQAFAGGLADSPAWERIASTDPDEQMPPPDSNLTLNSQQLGAVKQWLAEGAKWQGHWAFLPPVRSPAPDTPAHPQAAPIDRFLYQRLAQEGITPAPAADPATLLRRLSLDLTGLPPEPAEVAAFVADPSPQAYAAAVDRLLASPHFGERLALMWLDLVRYADSVGYHKDSHRDCFHYRDYVIDAFNQNTPYDQFVTEQLAGDLLTGSPLEEYRWKIASGFNRMIQTTSEGGAQPKEYLARYAADRVRNTSAIFLGTTMGCAECHDHKYDPFTANDFYSFAAFFADLAERGVGYPTHTPMPTLAQLDEWRRLSAQLDQLQRQRAPVTEDEPPAVEPEIAAVEARLAAVSRPENWQKTLITLTGKPREMRFLARGNWLDDSGPIVLPATPSFLTSAVIPADQATDNADAERLTRLDLARWIVAPDNPLPARVMVNRLWKLYFGEGLSRSLDDLGAQGGWPTHPELLDWLAIDFIDSGWDIKHAIRQMVLSEAYQRSSNGTPELRRIDPENRLLARQSSWRLPAELIRDNALAISGLLSPKMFGRSVRPYQPDNYWYRLYKDGKYVQDHGDDLYRRGLYTYWRRSFWHPSLRAFDAPAREECVAQRPRSNTPLQSLTLLNDPTYVEAARVLAAAMIEQGGAEPSDQIAFAFERAVARPPLPAELQVLTTLYAQQQANYQADPAAAKALLAVGEKPAPAEIDPAALAAATAVARTILNLHETITRN